MPSDQLSPFDRSAYLSGLPKQSIKNKMTAYLPSCFGYIFKVLFLLFKNKD